MRVSRITDSGDWTFGRGKSNYIEKSAAVRQSVLTRLRSFTNDYFADTTTGGDWLFILGQRNNSDMIIREVEKIVLKTYGVRSIDKLEISSADSNRNATIVLEFTDLFDQTYLEQVVIL